MNCLEDFADETGVFGLNLMRQHVPKTEKIIWICLTIVFTVFTIRDLQAVIKTFKEGETLTSVTLSDNESIMLDPAPIIYFRMRESCIQPKGNLSKDTLGHTLEETFAQTLWPDTLPDLLFNINVRLIGYINIDIERHALWPTKYSKPGEIDWDLLQAYNFYCANNISLIHLQKVTASLMCEKIGFTVTLPGEKNDTNICRPDLISEMHGLDLYIKLSSKPITFHDWSEHLQLSINNESVRLVDRIYIHLQGLLSIWNYKQKIPETLRVNLPENQNFQVRTLFQIQPVLQFKKAKRPNHDCSLETDCVTRCSVREIYNCTGHWPFSAPFRLQPATNSTTICPRNYALPLSDTFEHCVNNRTSNQGYYAICNNSCKTELPSCQLQIFSYTQISEIIHSSTKLEILYFVQLSSFPVFEEKLALTWQAFMAQFGGSLGLYLGVSFASLVHIPIFLIRLLASALGYKSKKSLTDAESSVHFEANPNEAIKIRVGIQQENIHNLASRLAAIEKQNSEILDQLKEHIAVCKR